MSMELQGSIKKVFPIREVKSERTGKSIDVQDFVFGFGKNQSIVLQLCDEKISHHNLSEGENIVVDVIMQHREYNGCLLNDIRLLDLRHQ